MYLSFGFFFQQSILFQTLFGIKELQLIRVWSNVIVPISLINQLTHPMAFDTLQPIVLNVDNTKTNNHVMQFIPFSQLLIKLQGDSNFSTWNLK